MELDIYQPCPCGTGKRIKFCCCKDILNDLDRVLRMFDGEQRLAAKEKLGRLLQKYPERAALLVLNAFSELQLGDREKAEQAINRVLEVHGDNPVGLALSAVLDVEDSDTKTAVTKIQRSLESMSEFSPGPIQDAVRAVADAMLAEGNVLGARGHYLMLAAMEDPEESWGTASILRMSRIQELSLLLRSDLTLLPCPENVTWKKEFDSVMDEAGRGCWDSAANRLHDMSLRVLDEPAIVKNLAVMRSRLGDVSATYTALKEYATLRTVPSDDAVEAESIAQLINPDPNEELVDIVGKTFEVTNMDRLMEILLSESRLVQVSADPFSVVDDDDGPSPKAIFCFLDRTSPVSGISITKDEISSVVAEVVVYGKQTDKDAHLIYAAPQTGLFEENLQDFRSKVSDQLGDEQDEAITDVSPALAEAMNPRWFFPQDTPRELRQSLLDEHRELAIFEVWPTVKQGCLEGLTPLEASEKPEFGLRLAATILRLELTTENSNNAVDLNPLRSKLGLPEVQAIEPVDESVDIAKIPAYRLNRLEVEKLSDEELTTAYHKALVPLARHAFRRLAQEAIRRDLGEDIDLANAYNFLARLSASSDQALKHIEDGRQWAVGQGQSPAKWMVDELSIRLSRGEIEHAQRLLNELRLRHLQEPGIADSINQVLAQYSSAHPEASQSEAPVESEPVLVSTTDTNEAATGLWTPDGDNVVASNDEGENQPGEGESKLWVPGMD